MDSLDELNKELRAVATLRERLYWEFTRGKQSPPVPAEVTRRFYELTERVQLERKRMNKAK